jgi:AraC-like DNA-binding protein
VFKHLLDTTEISILNIERYRVHTEWRHINVSSPYSRLYLITQGSGYIYYHKLKRKIDLKPGYMYLIPCYTLVDLYCPRTFVHYYIHFTARTHVDADLLSLVKCDYCVNAKRHHIDSEVFDRLAKLNPARQLMERDANKPIYGDILKRAIDLDKNADAVTLLQSNAIMRLLISSFLKSDQPPTVDNTIKGLDRFQTVIQFLHENLANKLSLPQLAHIASLHPTYFSNLFTQLMGISPAKYVNRLRIEKAQSLLLSSNVSLESVARQIGFDDVFYFSRVFKTFVGIPPAKYRKQLSNV